MPITWLLIICILIMLIFLRMCLFTWRCLGLAIVDASVSGKLLLLDNFEGADLQNGNWHEGCKIPFSLALCMSGNDTYWNRKSI